MCPTPAGNFGVSNHPRKNPKGRKEGIDYDAVTMTRTVFDTSSISHAETVNERIDDMTLVECKVLTAPSIISAIFVTCRNGDIACSVN
jgi:hypothetical protein